MLIKKIILENFGLYAGRQEFDLAPRIKYRRRRPIILFGGKNGAGKTTLLEAVRLTLYGKTALGARVRQIDYDLHLRNRIHRPKGEFLPQNGTMVAVEFEYVRLGNKHIYRIERSWSAKGRASVDEQFRLFEDGAPVVDQDRDVAEAFAREIVPEGLSQLFFFDGEKIRELAEDDTGNAGLADAIKALLGLDMVERLSADLSIYASRKAAELGSDEDRRRLDDATREIKRVNEQIEELQERVAAGITEIAGVEAEIRQHEDRLRNEGQAYAKDRAELKTQEAQHKGDILRLESELRSLCDGAFPFVLCPQTAAGLRKQLGAADDQRRSRYVEKEVNNNLKAVVELIRKGRADDDLLKKVKLFFEKRLNSLVAVAPSPFVDMAETEAASVLRDLDDAEIHARPRAHSLCNGLEKAYSGLRNVGLQLSRMPADDVVQPIFHTIQQLNQRLGSLRQAQSSLTEELARLSLQVAEHERRKKRLENDIQDRQIIGDKLKLVDRSKAALGEYLEQLTRRKIDDLRQSVVQCFNHLSRKGDVIQDIKIDPVAFNVTLFDRGGTAISKTELSSGEKQIYAIAMLWGLARTSGRPLPVIIDTPLGRLDSDHRLNLCREYFPRASHQVILLSTDTEVDQKLFDELSPSVSHCYHLSFDTANESTTATEEYFFRELTNA